MGDEHSVHAALHAIVQHYNQPVHVVEERPPYFDPLLGHPPQIPPVIQLWIDRLILHEPENIVQWIHGYITMVRSILIQSQPSTGSVAVLQYFELIFSKWLDYDRKIHEKLSVKPTDLAILSRTLEVLASDITLLTAPDEIKLSLYHRSNIVLPTLMRLIYHILGILLDYEAVQLDQKALLRCFVSLLAFDPCRIDPPFVASSLLQPKKLQALCSYSPPDQGADDVDDEFLSLKSVDWTSVSLDGTLWNDPVVGVASRAADAVWKRLSVLCVDDENPNVVVKDDSKTEAPHQGETRRKMQSRILHSTLVGVERVSEAVRAHFFGRDMVLWDSEQRVSTRVMLGRTVETTEPVVKEKAYKLVPSRVHVFASFISLLGQQDKYSTREVLVQVLPVCFELIEASSVRHMAIGSTCLIHLLETIGVGDSVWDEFVGNALPVLDMAFKTNREGPMLLLVGRAQCLLFEAMGEGNKERRQATLQWLTALNQTAHRSVSEMICWELLIAGVVPLLQQHANLPDADAMELGRLGLSTLLPLVAGDFVDSKTQKAALVALINLMMGAYPIIPHHGGKIMSTLLIAAARASSNEDGDMSYLYLIVVHAAAVAMALCVTNKRAGEVVEDIISASDSFQPRLVRAAREVRERADRYLDKGNAATEPSEQGNSCSSPDTFEAPN
jgi:hypothetical protein